MTSFLKKGNVQLISNNNKLFEIDSKISLISKVIKSIITESDSDSDNKNTETIPAYKKRLNSNDLKSSI